MHVWLGRRVVRSRRSMKVAGSELPLTVIGAAIQVDAVGGAGEVFHPSRALGAVERQRRNGGSFRRVVITRPAGAECSHRWSSSRNPKPSGTDPSLEHTIDAPTFPRPP